MQIKQLEWKRRKLKSLYPASPSQGLSVSGCVVWCCVVRCCAVLCGHRGRGVRPVSAGGRPGQETQRPSRHGGEMAQRGIRQEAPAVALS